MLPKHTMNIVPSALNKYRDRVCKSIEMTGFYPTILKFPELGPDIYLTEQVSKINTQTNLHGDQKHRKGHEQEKAGRTSTKSEKRCCFISLLSTMVCPLAIVKGGHQRKQYASKAHVVHVMRQRDLFHVQL